jgi:hypothetical protein
VAHRTDASEEPDALTQLLELSRVDPRRNGLGQEIERTSAQRIEGQSTGATTGITRENENRRGRTSHDRLDGREPVEARHLNVHRHEIGPEPFDELDGRATVDCMPDDAKSTVGFDPLAQ